MVIQLIKFGGVDIVKVGIGSGSVCTTRIQAGVGCPQFTAVVECAHAAHGLKSGERRMGLICSDGGCKEAGDVSKAFGAGADFVMLGGMFAGTDECDGDWTYEYKGCHGHWQSIKGSSPFPEKRKKSLKFYGMSSYEAQEIYDNKAPHRGPEGKCVHIPYKGPAANVMKKIEAGVRSACAYNGATRLADLHKCAEFRIIAGSTHNRVFE
jgi:GMP reductase